MVFKSRTVIVLVIIAMAFGVLLTQAVDTLKLVNAPQQGAIDNNNRDLARSPDQLWKESGLSIEQINKLASTYYLINDQFYKDADPEAVINGAINGMLSVLGDPYTVYMDEEQARSFQETVIDSTFSGIGAEVTLEDGKVTVVSPIKGSPAEKAGIIAKDQILSVNGEKLEGLSLNESVMKIRGPKGTQAKLEILRSGATESVEIIVVRDDIDVETVYSDMLEEHIGKIEIRRFSVNTADRFHEELAELEKKGMEGLIIDVRNNPGGVLPTVIDLLEPLIPAGRAIVQIEDRDGRRSAELSKHGALKNYPIVVVTNEGSASASEILAAALQESAGATIIGEDTFGKGTVQSPFELGTGDGSTIKMTISKWLTPNGNFIHEIGVKPNIYVELPAYFRTTPLPRDTVLTYDMIGHDVRNLQLILEGLDLQPGRDDGYFSEETKMAVEQFQAAHELPVTGEVDEQTAAYLEEAIINEMRKSENDTQITRAVKFLNNQLRK